MMKSLTEQLTDQLLTPINTIDLHRASLHLLDWLSCAISGLGSTQAEFISRYLKKFGKPGDCITLGQDNYHWESALLFNGALGNINEMDDLHRQSVIHPGPVVIPSALAVAQLLNATPTALLESIIRGYEACIRIGRALGDDHYKFFHNTSTCGSFGSAAVTASLLNLDEQQWVSALGNAGTRTGGLWQLRHENVMSKQLHTAEAARSGVLSAMLASYGFTGPKEILEGSQGLFNATSPQAKQELVVKKEPQWLIHECSFKPWPTCRHTHPAIDAAKNVRKHLVDKFSEQFNKKRWTDKDFINTQIIKENNIKYLAVGTYRDALTFCDNPKPRTEQEAKFSVQHCVAVALLYESPDWFYLRNNNLQQPAVKALREKIEVVVDPIIDARYREHWGATIKTVFCDDSTVDISITDAFGDPDNPMQQEDIINKAYSYMKSLPAAKIKNLCETVLDLPITKDLSPFNKLLAEI